MLKCRLLVGEQTNQMLSWSAEDFFSANNSVPMMTGRKDFPLISSISAIIMSAPLFHSEEGEQEVMSFTPLDCLEFSRADAALTKQTQKKGLNAETHQL